MPTGLASPSVAQKAQRPPSSSKVGRLASSDSIDAGGFTPGAILAERYRVIGLLGRGGMGEVYRADDLKLGQPVALKFLPPHLAADRDRVERFFTEVRLARQVSHPNVCRVYDVGEIGGQHFLSMEYVDGEDLGALLRRIGRFPGDRALEISRQLCAGLAAAHDKGVLHRDLKPSNVMIDGRGRARITDFGLAVAASKVQEGEVSGTPAYMAPEQLAGKGASIRSDIYALGLVLYELSTGKKAFDAASLDDLRRKHTEGTPTAPSAVAPGFDPAVERVILRCLEKDPAQRPSSVAQVAAALPGGDPLAAALAAGETPSPEMVAAAGDEQQIAPGLARALLATVVVALVLGFALVGKTRLLAAVDSQKSPDVLEARAREILASLGMPDRPADRAADFFANDDFIGWVGDHDTSPDRWRRGIARDAIDFRYRQSPTVLVTVRVLAAPFPGPRVTEYDPPPTQQTGDVRMTLDAEGRLKFLAVEPRELDKTSGPAPSPDWAPLFRAAGLDMARFTRVEPQWSPSVYADTRAAWEGPHPERPGLTMRVEAAANRGRPVSFQWLGPWSRPVRDIFDVRTAGSQFAQLAFDAILCVLLFGGVWLVRGNLRSGRGDRRGAMRLATAAFLCELAAWALGAHHVPASFEFELIFANGLSNAFLFGGFIWVIYLAVEPYARRNWPHMLISWTRLLGGRFRDPLVGRDLLVGAAGAALTETVRDLFAALWPGSASPAPLAPFYTASARDAMALAVSLPVASLVWVLGIVLFLAFARRWLRLKWLATLLVTALFSTNFLGFDPPYVASGVVSVAILVFVATRFGLLAALLTDVLGTALFYFVRSADSSAWYFYPGPIAGIAVLALAVWGYRRAVPARAFALAEA